MYSVFGYDFHNIAKPRFLGGPLVQAKVWEKNLMKKKLVRLIKLVQGCFTNIPSKVGQLRL